MANKRATNKRTSGRRRAVLGLAVVLVLAGAAAVGYAVTRGWPGSPTAASATTTMPSAGATTGATTAPAPDTVGVSAGPRDGQVVATDKPVPATGNAATVVVTYADWNAAAGQVEVGGYITGVVEEGGTCTLTLTQGGRSAAAEVPATPDVATTACGQVVIPGARLGAGTWQGVLSYRSGSSTGAADAVAVEVTR